MESPLWPMIWLLASVTLLLLSALLLLLWRFLSQQNRHQQQMLEFQSRLMTSTAEAMKTVTSETTKQLMAQLQQLTSSRSSTTSELIQALSQAQTMLQSKDPMAYQVLTGANAIATSSPAPLYSSARSDQLPTIEELEQMQAHLESLGVTPDVNVFTSTGYPTLDVDSEPPV